MSHQDHKASSGPLNSVCLGRVLQRLLAGIDWRSLAFRDDCSWTPRLLTSAALVWVWSDDLTLRDRFWTARRLVAHLFPDHSPPATSYQAFLKVLVRWTKSLISLLQAALRRRMREEFQPLWTICGYAVFGVDGSRLELPRTKSHEAAHSPSPTRSGKKKRDRRKRPDLIAHQKKATLPLLWLTTLFHLGTSQPWSWRIGPSDSSERQHALDMLHELPEGALLTADAGFTGYEFIRAILDSGRHLLVRVGANIRLLKKLGFVRESNGIVYLWPEKAEKQRLPPLVFRRVLVAGPRHPVYLITSLWEPHQLSDEQVWELYQRRWGIELFYRHLKHTFQRRKLRSASASNALVELEWSLVGLWALALSAALELIPQQIPPQRISVAGILRAIRRLIRDYLHPRQQTSRSVFRDAVVDDYVRKNKHSRDYPRKKQHQAAGLPTVVTATTHQIRVAIALRPAA